MPRPNQPRRVGFKVLVISLNVVDFPAPFEPMIPSARPRWTSKLTSWSAQTDVEDRATRMAQNRANPMPEHEGASTPDLRSLEVSARETFVRSEAE